MNQVSQAPAQWLCTCGIDAMEPFVDREDFHCTVKSFALFVTFTTQDPAQAARSELALSLP